MFLGVKSVAFFVTGVQSAVTSYTICSYMSVGGTCESSSGCIDGCEVEETANMCPHYTCDCLAGLLSVTFDECISIGGVDQVWECFEDSTDPEPFQGYLCPTVASTDESDPELEPETSDDGPMPELTHSPSYGPTSLVPTYAPTYAPSYASPCGNFGLCWTYCPIGDGTCTDETCTTSGSDWEGGYPNCTGYDKLISGMYPQFEAWGECFDVFGRDVLITCNRDNTPCENYDLCVTACAYGEGDGTCSGTQCYTQGWNLGDGFDNCTGFYTEISGMFPQFEGWGNCFTTSDGRDHMLTCNVDPEISSSSSSSSSSTADIAMIIGIVVGAVVLIVITVCCVLYRRSAKTL